jgi:hypothetical protein
MSIPARIEAREGLFAIRPNLYIFVVLIVILAASVYKLWCDSILPCSAKGYDSDHYLSYCQAEGYGDYEHGAFWFGLEPTALNFAKKADVLFVGESRLQYAFSTRATSDWFMAASSSYYLLGFLSENSVFADALLRKLSPQAKVYVINVDTFFERSETPLAKLVIRDENARTRYEEKRWWQHKHQSICRIFSAICGGEYGLFRSRQTGTYNESGGVDRVWYKAPVSYDQATDQTITNDYAATAADFLSHLPVKPDCIIFTIIPNIRTQIRTAKTIASDLGIDFVAPELDGLQTFDRAHLDRPSAERWSAAFFLAATPQILKCLNKSTASLSTFPSQGSPPTGTPDKR